MVTQQLGPRAVHEIDEASRVKNGIYLRRVWNQRANATSNVTYVRELNYAHLSEVTKAVVSSIFIDNQGDVLHRFGAEPASHVEILFEVSTLQQRVCCLINPKDRFCVLV